MEQCSEKNNTRWSRYSRENDNLFHLTRVSRTQRDPAGLLEQPGKTHPEPR